MPTKKPKPKTFKVLCSWSFTAEVLVKAMDEDEALDIIDGRDLPKNGEYLPGSFQADQVQEI